MTFSLDEDKRALAEQKNGPGKTRPGVSEWSRRQDSNLQQAVYKTATLPLRHAGTLKSAMTVYANNPKSQSTIPQIATYTTEYGTHRTGA